MQYTVHCSVTSEVNLERQYCFSLASATKQVVGTTETINKEITYSLQYIYLDQHTS